MKDITSSNTSETNNDSNYFALFNNLIKFIDIISDNTIKNSNNELLSEKISAKFKEINNKEIDITLIKDNLNNTLIQYYIIKETDTIEIISEIINYYYNALLNIDKDAFYKWLINDNSEHFNIFELIVEKQFSLSKQIALFNNLFSYFNSGDNSLIYKTLKNRDNNIFHFCVKQNNIPLLLFLYEKLKKFFPSLNILDIKNNEGMTPLHISCLYSVKNASDNLLLLGCNINEKDNVGNTPLHYAAKGGNIKLAKKLILFGAEKFMRNNEYYSPKDIARKSANFSMEKLFKKKLFDQISSIKDKRRENILSILIIICFLVKLLFFIKYGKGFKLISSFSFIFDFICCGFILYPKICNNKLYKAKKKVNNNYNLLNKQVKFEDIYKLYNYELEKIEQLCPICKIIKQSKTKHCIICNKCIENWDHHCYWLNICINKETYNFFIWFIITLFILILFNIIIFMSLLFNIKIFSNSLNYINLVVFMFIFFILFIHVYGFCSIIRQFNQIHKNKKIDNQRILSLEDLLSNSSSLSFSENQNKPIEFKYSNYKNIGSQGKNSSIEFQEII